MSATAPGKIILFGEHAVVYGQPAIAAPLSQVRAKAEIHPLPGESVYLIAPDLGIERVLDETADDDAFALAVRLVHQAAGPARMPGMVITITSQIPIASGLGSGAAITAAIIRALARFLKRWELEDDGWVSALTFEVEKIHHGTPSGIDNTVVAYERPIYFVRRQPENLVEPFSIRDPLSLLIGDTGISSSTKIVVGDVRRQWQADPTRFNRLFADCGALSKAARAAIEAGDLAQVGQLMTENHALLVDMTVSSPELDNLVSAAMSAGALGAKMSGGGRGGNMVALVTADSEAGVRQAMLRAGAAQVLHSVVQGANGP